MSEDSGAPGALEVYDDPEALARATADLLLGEAEKSQGRFVLCLSGGSTPKRLYELLGGEPYAARMPWDRVHLFWGDERFVSHADPDSNYGMTAKALLDHARIPPGNIHPVSDQGTPEEAAEAYEAELKRFYGSDHFEEGRLLFDLVLLGIGEDGHTASLIPGATALEERVRWAVAVTSGRPEPRITLTYPALNNSRLTAFLATGEKKRPVLEPLVAGRSTAPAGGIRPAGRLLYMVDKAAAPAP